jgi:hypothetical protein
MLQVAAPPAPVAEGISARSVPAMGAAEAARADRSMATGSWRKRSTPSGSIPPSRATPTCSSSVAMVGAAERIRAMTAARMNLASARATVASTPSASAWTVQRSRAAAKAWAS